MVFKAPFSTWLMVSGNAGQNVKFHRVEYVRFNRLSAYLSLCPFPSFEVFAQATALNVTVFQGDFPLYLFKNDVTWSDVSYSVNVVIKS